MFWFGNVIFFINVIFFDLLKEQLLLHGTKISSVIKFLLDNEYHLYHSMGQNKEKRHIFNIGNQNRIYYPMNVKKMLEKENRKEHQTTED